MMKQKAESAGVIVSGVGFHLCKATVAVGSVVAGPCVAPNQRDWV